MNKLATFTFGAILILIGILGLTGGFILPLVGLSFVWMASWLWPLLVVGLGLAFVLPAIFGSRGLGGLFIPGMPVLATGLILFLSNTFYWWSIWSYLWPLEVLAVALGFLFAGIKLRVVWLVIPAALVGLNGIVLQFCALTGWWAAWSVLWTVEPLAFGLAFLIISLVRRSPVFLALGLGFAGFAGVAFLGMLGIMVGFHVSGGILTLLNMAWPGMLIMLGAFILLLGLVRRPTPALR